MATAKKPVTRSTDPNVRKSPPLSASQFPEGHTSKGNDGNYWIISESANGVKRWVPANKWAPTNKTASTAKATSTSKVVSQFQVNDFFVKKDDDDNWKLFYIQSIKKSVNPSNGNFISILEIDTNLTLSYLESTLQGFLDDNTYIYRYIPQVGDIIVKDSLLKPLKITIDEIDSKTGLTTVSSKMSSSYLQTYTKEEFTRLLVNKGISVLNFNPNATESKVQEAETKIDDIVFSAPVVPVGTEDQRNATDKLVDEFIAKNENNIKKLSVDNVDLLSTIDKTLEFIKAKFGTPAPVTSISNVASAPSQTQPIGGIDDYKLIQFIGEDGERKVIEFKKFKTGKNANVFKYLLGVFKYLIGDVFLVRDSPNQINNYIYVKIIGAVETGSKQGKIKYVESYLGNLDRGLTWNSRVIEISVSEFDGYIEDGFWEFVPGSNENLKKLNELASQTQASSSSQTAKKTSLSLGDKVKISKSSQYYGTSASNPKNVEGEIIGIVKALPFSIKVKWANGKSNTYPENDLELVTTKLSKVAGTATPAPASTTTSGGSTTANVGDTVIFYASREKTNLQGIVKSIITGTDGKPYLRINVNGKFYLKQQGSVKKV